ncbi:hypothetical protein RradSPS_3001 (plasmid) [Rubrobacter radiotolerans]|uniref:Abasic site processing protein n=1 Tax=Rubrobacter radiotolerans TaxID=42256 RepID=A0A023X889_RUBRA|nr:SOS response-associated peptidase [Rubrobacter radiotolerans]AHY48284.1 hypothetical protein RradSPS_3001 [Rubrobacter radiotolerans]MDX5895557.1 SOS response-associated peptidase [Rubrobacter radiotolerans]SMC01481.1 Putative SOS response-associated peptidase YedK [Rubrobacter radiotolerans DSM 5868]
MCGRYTLRTPPERLAQVFGVEGPLPEWSGPSYNVAPSQRVLAVVGADGGRRFEHLRWGLAPAWSKDPSSGPINARSETVAEKPSFRSAFRSRRALIPADGYYEWKRVGKGPKQPYLFTLAGGEPFAFAGLWERWGEGEEELRTAALLTTEPNAVAREVHDRMPVILPREAYDLWLDPDAEKEELLALLAPYPAREMEAYPVSTHVNSPKNNDPECVRPV